MKRRGLLALAATIYLAAMGKYGIQEVANLCLQKARYLADELDKIKGINVIKNKAFFKELAGIDLKKWGSEGHILVTVTEKRTKEEMDMYVSVMTEVLNK